MIVKEFEVALTYVREHYPDLFDSTLDPIALVPSNRMGGVNGRFWPIRDRSAYKDPVSAGRTFIQIRRGRRSVADYVGTLVHELTHLQQHVSGRAKSMISEEREAEADAAGCEAQSRFVRETFKTIWERADVEGRR